MTHNWPTDPEEHIFGPWENESWKPPKPPIQYRTCVHPDCKQIERRVAPKA